MRQGGGDGDMEMSGDRGGARYPSNNQEGASDPEDEDSEDDDQNYAN